MKFSKKQCNEKHNWYIIHFDFNFNFIEKTSSICILYNQTSIYLKNTPQAYTDVYGNRQLKPI